MTLRRKSLTAGKFSAAVGSIAAAVMLMAAPAAHADLVFSGYVANTGSGLGNVSTLVTAQDNGVGRGDGTESGCVASSGGSTFTRGICAPGTEVVGGDEGTGASQTLTRQLSTLGTGFVAGDLALVVNLNEGSVGQTAVLTGLYLALYTSGGELLNTYQYTGLDLTLNQTPGTGGSGALFTLDTAQAADATSRCSDLTQCYAGAGFQFANGTTSGGSETVYIAVANGDVVVQPPQEIPEPGALALFGVAGVLGALAARRRRAPSA